MSLRAGTVSDLSSRRSVGGDTRYNPYPTRVRVPLCPAPWSINDLTRAAIAPKLAAESAATAGIRQALGIASPIVLTSSGTAALALALSTLRRADDDEVVIPTFVCPG